MWAWFLCLLGSFVFSIISLVIRFTYMCISGDFSASGVYDDGGRRLCTAFGVMSGEFAKHFFVMRHVVA